MENIETKNLKEILTIAREIVTMKRDNAEWELNVLSDSERIFNQLQSKNYGKSK